MASGPSPHPSRLQKILAAAGVASRRAAEELIRQGRVTVNGRTAGVGDVADPRRDRIELDGERLKVEKTVYWMLNKPPGVVTTRRDPQGRPTVMDLMPPQAAHLYPVGRLDRATEGLLLLTNDGPTTQVLLHPAHGSEREYRVTARGEVPGKALRRLARGLRLKDGPTAPADVGPAHFDTKTDTTTFALTLIQGRKRQIRRSMAFLHHPVVRLVRVRMGPLRLGRLSPGEARPLRRDEVQALRRHTERLAGRSRSL